VFVGEYERSMDGNGRLALPSAFRDELGDRCYATREPTGCISITSVATFDADAERLMGRVDDGELPASALRNFGVNSSVVGIDKQGRITLDDESRQFAGITPGAQVVIAGALKSLEVWRPSRYRTVRGEDGMTQPPRVWIDELEEADETDVTDETAGGGGR
jgi:MraZ protein